MSRTSTTSFQGRKLDRVAKQGGNVVTYFCTPHQLVLGWVVGPVTSDDLVAEAKQALKSRQVLHRWSQRDGDTQREQIREHFLSQIHPANRQGMRLWTSFKPEQRLNADREAVARILSLAKTTQRKTQGLASAEISRLGRGGRFRNPEVRAESLRIQNSIRSDLSRMVIAELPLLKLDQVQEPVFESLANQAFEPRSERNEELLTAINANIASGKPTVLRLASDHRTPARDDELPELLDRFTVLQLTAKELTRLSDDLGHAPVETSRDVMRFVVLNGKGERTGVITQVLYGKRIVGYRSVLRDEVARPQRRLDTLLLEELQLALAAK